MGQSEPVAERESRCPTCNAGWLHDKILAEDRFEYEDDGETKTVIARNVPVRECDNPDCRERLSGPEAARIRHEAICRALCLLTPAEIRAIRERVAGSLEEFSRLTGIGVASISRWERGRLLQNRSMDLCLRFLDRDEENVRFARRLREAANGDQSSHEGEAETFTLRMPEIREKASRGQPPFDLHCEAA